MMEIEMVFPAASEVHIEEVMPSGENFLLPPTSSRLTRDYRVGSSDQQCDSSAGGQSEIEVATPSYLVKAHNL